MVVEVIRRKFFIVPCYPSCRPRFLPPFYITERYFFGFKFQGKVHTYSLLPGRIGMFTIYSGLYTGRLDNVHLYVPAFTFHR